MIRNFLNIIFGFPSKRVDPCKEYYHLSRKERATKCVFLWFLNSDFAIAGATEKDIHILDDKDWMSVLRDQRILFIVTAA